MRAIAHQERSFINKNFCIYSIIILQVKQAEKIKMIAKQWSLIDIEGSFLHNTLKYL